MRWTVGRRRLGLLALLCGSVLAAAGAEAKQLLVVSSTAPQLKPGQIVEGDQPLALPPGSTVKLVDTDGSTVNLQGPFDGRPAPGKQAGDGGLLTALSKLVSSSRVDSSALGAIRGLGIGEAPPAPDPWQIDTTQSGTWCTLAGSPPRLRRLDTGGHGSGSLQHLGTAGTPPTGEIRWPAGKEDAAWPAALPTAGRFLLTRGHGQSPVRLTLKPVPADLGKDALRAAWMAENGCVEQARILLKVMK